MKNNTEILAENNTMFVKGIAIIRILMYHL